jgi:membrane-bound lytic murein transglycosylase D
MVIPADKLETFAHNLEAHEESDKPLSSWQAYTLRPGEKLEEVAPRFGMTVAGLKALNGLQGRIRVASGATLLVAGEGNEPEDMGLKALPEEQPLVFAAAGPASGPAEQPAAEKPAPGAGTRTSTHEVRKGETLSAIARRYGMSLAELKRLNKLRSNTAKYGTRLTVTSSTQASASTRVKTEIASKETPAKSKPTRAASGPTTAAAAAPRTHTVRRGETLSSIAQRYDMSVGELKKLNKLRSDQVTSGTKLRVQS